MTWSLSLYSAGQTCTQSCHPEVAVIRGDSNVTVTPDCRLPRGRALPSDSPARLPPPASLLGVAATTSHAGCPGCACLVPVLCRHVGLAHEPGAARGHGEPSGGEPTLAQGSATGSCSAPSVRSVRLHCFCVCLTPVLVQHQDVHWKWCGLWNSAYRSPRPPTCPGTHPLVPNVYLLHIQRLLCLVAQPRRDVAAILPGGCWLGPGGTEGWRTPQPTGHTV